MKIHIISFILFISINLASCVATPPLPESIQGFDIVVDVPEKTKDQIYIITKIWLAETFNSSKAVIELDSKEEGLLIGNGIIAYPCNSGISCLGTSGWKVPFTMNIAIKEQKIKMTFSKIMLSMPGQPGAYPSAITTIKSQKDMDVIKPALLDLSKKLIADINKNKAKNDW